jgi:hypothetical protein
MESTSDRNEFCLNFTLAEVYYDLLKSTLTVVAVTCDKHV